MDSHFTIIPGYTNYSDKDNRLEIYSLWITQEVNYRMSTKTKPDKNNPKNSPSRSNDPNDQGRPRVQNNKK